MCNAGLLIRTHGGASLPKNSDSKPAVQKSIAKFIEEKKRISEKAYEFISDGEAIIIDDSSTGYFLASHIAKHPEKELIVVTNGIRTAFELSESAHVELHVIGGYVGGQSGGHLSSTLGDEAVAAIEFENGYLSIVSPMSPDFIIITDTGLEKETISRANSMGLNMLVV